MQIEFHGMPTRSLGNEHLRLDYLAEAGPRIVRLCLAGSDDNLLADAIDVSWDTPYGIYHLFGGHRLWHAPEAPSRSSVPDDRGLEIWKLPDGVRLSGAVEAPTGIRKTIEIRLQEDRAGVAVRHTLRNEGLWPVELAAWAITQVPLGGVAVLPLTAPEASRVLPNRQLVLWPYTRLTDPRLHLHDDYVLIDGAAGERQFKLGYFNHAGWLAYLRNGVCFCKRFAPQPGRPHADLNCNAEVFCNDRFLEVETVGPLVRLEPGQETVHDEVWQITAVAQSGQGIDDVRQLALDMER